MLHSLLVDMVPHNSLTRICAERKPLWVSQLKATEVDPGQHNFDNKTREAGSENHQKHQDPGQAEPRPDPVKEPDDSTTTGTRGMCGYRSLHYLCHLRELGAAAAAARIVK